MKGYLFIQTVVEYEKEKRHIDYFQEPEPERSYEARGWQPLAQCIKSGAFLKLCAEHRGVRVEARFNIEQNVPSGDNGLCEISDGPFKGTGIFRNVRREENADFRLFFICHSASWDGKFLRWRIGVKEFVDADNIPDVE